MLDAKPCPHVWQFVEIKKVKNKGTGGRRLSIYTCPLCGAEKRRTPEVPLYAGR